MLITCPGCSHRFDAESVVIRRGYFPVRCSKCESRFEVNFRSGETRARSEDATAEVVHASATGARAAVEHAVPATTVAQPPTEPAPTERSVGAQRFIAAIRRDYDGLTKKDPFELLGVQVESSNQEVMKAYFETTERFRGEAYEGQLTNDEKAMLWDLTSRVDAAFNELGDLERRRRAHRMRSRTFRRMEAPTVEIKGGAEARYVKGYQAFQTGDFATARDHFAECVELDPTRASYHFRVGQATLRLGETGEPVDWDAVHQAFELALELDSDNLEYLMAFGKLFKARGNPSLAMPYFKRVRDVDPEHPDANREIQAYLTQKRNAGQHRSTTARLFSLLKRKTPAPE